jgi:hypothetical protein
MDASIMLRLKYPFQNRLFKHYEFRIKLGNTASNSLAGYAKATVLT